MFKSSSSTYFLHPISNGNSRFRVRDIYKDLFKNVDSIFFMDDDLLDYLAIQSLPPPYAFRIFLKTTIWRRRVKLYSKFLVSTQYLEKKYQNYSPKLIKPIASEDLLIREWDKVAIENDNHTVKICYHGSWSHRNDMKWFAPIIYEVQRFCPEVHFEVIGGDRVARIFKKVPRITVLDTMSWQDYLRYTQNNRFDIGVAPLLDTLFNRGRGPIKFFDYARCGAVGVYSSGPAFDSFVADGVDGFILKNDQQLWINTLVKLVRSPEQRGRMYEAAWQKVLDNSTESPEIQAYLADLREHIKSLP